MIRKIAYVCRWAMENNDGVSQKIRNQMSAWRELGYDVRLFCRSPLASDNFPGQGIYKMPRPFSFFRAYDNIVSDIEAFEPDLVYCRYEVPATFIVNLSKKFKNVIAVEINADDLSELKLLVRKHPLRYFPRLFFSLLWRKTILRNCACVVAVTHELARLPEISRLGKKTVVAPNSINLQLNPIVKQPGNSNRIELLFLGSPDQPWHGVDKVLKLADLLGDKYFFHVVGPKAALESTANVFWHGFLGPDEYRKVAASCTAGIGTLAFHRKNMDEACTLKVREYIAMGLPVIIGYKETAFMYNQPSWAFQIPNCENSITSELARDLAIFLESMRDKVVSHEESLEYVDSGSLEKRRIDNIQNCLAEV